MGEHTAIQRRRNVRHIEDAEDKRPRNNPISDEALELIGERGTGLVFPDFRDKMTQAPLKKWLKAAGITKHLSFHSSRHTFGSLQVDAGTSIYVVQKMLAHKNVSTTEIYANMADEQKRQSVNRITLKPTIRTEKATMVIG